MMPVYAFTYRQTCHDKVIRDVVTIRRCGEVNLYAIPAHGLSCERVLLIEPCVQLVHVTKPMPFTSRVVPADMSEVVDTSLPTPSGPEDFMILTLCFVIDAMLHLLTGRSGRCSRKRR